MPGLIGFYKNSERDARARERERLTKYCTVQFDLAWSGTRIASLGCERDPSVGRAQTDAPRVQRVGRADRPTLRYAAPHGRVGQTGATRGGSRRAYAPLRAVLCGPRLPNSAAGHALRNVAARRTSCTQKQAGLLGKIRGSGSKALWSSLPQVSQMVPRPGSNPGGTDPRRR